MIIQCEGLAGVESVDFAAAVVIDRIGVIVEEIHCRVTLPLITVLIENIVISNKLTTGKLMKIICANISLLLERWII